MRKLTLLFLAILAATSWLVSGCTRIENSYEGKPQPWVMTFFAPIYAFTSSVAGPDGTVDCLLDGTGIHDYQMVPRDAVQLSHAQLFFINGLEIDDDLRPKAEGRRRQRGPEAGPRRRRDPRRPAAADRSRARPWPGSQPTASTASTATAQYDPHVWLGIPEAIQMVERDS